MKKAFLTLSLLGLCLTSNTTHGAHLIDLSNQNITDTTITAAITTAVSNAPAGTPLDINLSSNRITRSGLSTLITYLSALTCPIQTIDLSINNVGASDVTSVYSTLPAPYTIDPSIIKLR
jgi:hypothetical protein